MQERIEHYTSLAINLSSSAQKPPLSAPRSGGKSVTGASVSGDREAEHLLSPINALDAETGGSPSANFIDGVTPVRASAIVAALDADVTAATVPAAAAAAAAAAPAPAPTGLTSGGIIVHVNVGVVNVKLKVGQRRRDAPADSNRGVSVNGASSPPRLAAHVVS